ncbi:hypothetical protein AAFN60_01510 [Roseibacillus persicicus]|uniref:hypothetical protein n=1 Tax=Roseibacillus persicicus TaxID=454148 RepID=UPI00398A5478
MSKNPEPIILSNNAELEKLFEENKSAYQSLKGAYTASVYGNLRLLDEMPCYQLAFSPYRELAAECEMEHFSLRQSLATGRIYLWNLNYGGHAPRLELRPVKLTHLQDLPLMKRYHENWGYELSLKIDKNPRYEI